MFCFECSAELGVLRKVVYLNCLTLPQGEVKVHFLCEEEVLVSKMIQLGYIRIKTSKFLGQKIRIIHHKNLVFVTQMYLYIIYALYIMYMICNGKSMVPETY